MMKKIIFGIILSLFLFLGVFAAGSSGSSNADAGGSQEDSGNADAPQGENTNTQTQNMGEETQLRVTTIQKAGTVTELKQMMQQRTQEMASEAEGLKGGEAKAYQNQNAVREAVHNLQSMEGLLGGIGPQVSEIAREWNNGVNKTLQSEEKIQSRSTIAKLFGGGDNEAAAEIEQQVEQNRNQLQELNRLYENCSAGTEVCGVLQEQIQNMEQEQNRLGELAEKNKGKGILGWIWK